LRSTLPSGREPDDEDEIDEDWDAADPEGDDDVDDPAFRTEEDDDGEETVPCPECRRPVYEAADYCPACGAAIVPDDQGPSRKAWIVAGVLIVALLGGALCWL
jgi:hypothetical protein